MKIGYARISTATGEQKLDHQTDELTKAGCERIFTDAASGALTDRVGLKECLAFAREGDVIVIWKLDRIARSLAHLLAVVSELNERKIGLQSLTEGIDTSTATGILLLHVLGALGQFERSLIVERTRSGLLAARARGRKGGRPRSVTDEKLRLATVMLREPQTTVRQVCQVLGVSKGSLYRYLPMRELRPVEPSNIEVPA